MEIILTSSGVVRRSTPSVRYKPYDIETASKAERKEKLIQQGVELSLFVAESMFLLCDDIKTMLWFCFSLRRCRVLYRNPVSDRLLHVIHIVYSNYIKPKNGVFRDDGTSVQWELIRTTWEDFVAGIMVLYRIFAVLRRKGCGADYSILWAIQMHKQELKKLDDKLRPAKDVSEANGFVRERIESDIYVLWKSLFDDETGGELIRTRMVSDLFKPILGDSRRSQILALPACPNYILRKDYVKDPLKEDVVQLAVELSLLVAQSMFLLCDDIRTLLWFCFLVSRSVNLNPPDNQVVLVRIIHVMHYVYLKDIKPKNRVYQIGGQSAQRGVIMETWENIAAGFRGMDLLVLSLRGEGSGGLSNMYSIEKEVKMVEEKLECVKGVSEANGFVRDALESTFLDLWKSLLDKEAKEATWTLRAIRKGMFVDLFLPIHKEVIPPH